MSCYERGICAEAYAEKFLINKGFCSFKKRFKTPYGEIDLLMQDDMVWVAVEVKYRKSHVEESISDRQKQRIKNAMLCFMASQGQEVLARFDVVLITPLTYSPYFDIIHIENAW